MQTQIENVLSKLEKVRRNGSGYQALCPSHEDENPSLSIDTGTDGRVLVFCHAGCSFDSIVQSLGMSAQDLMPQNGHSTNGSFNKMKSSKIYDYKDESGKLLFQILRYENPKDFSARQPDGNGGWIWKLKGVSPVLYRLPELLKSDSTEVLVCEGEKDCDNAISKGFCATTNPLGATNWRPEYNLYCKEKDVVIIQDNDEKGSKRTKILIDNLIAEGKSIKIIDFSEILPWKGSDLSDYFQKYDYNDLRTLIDSTPVYKEKGCSPLTSNVSELVGLHLTDSGNAEAIVHLYGEKLRFDHTLGKWFDWNGHTWEVDENGHVNRLALETARERLRGAADIEDKNERSKAANWALQSESNYRISAALRLALVMNPIATTRKMFDTDSMLLGCANGVVELKTGHLRPGKPENMISMSTGIIFDSKAAAPRWQQFLNEVFSDNENLIEFVQKLIGYFLTGLTSEQMFALLVGVGENGKSVFLAVLRYIFGDYAANTPFSTFSQSKYDTSKISNDMAALAGRRFVTASEVRENTLLNEGTIKAVTGQDDITARFLHREYFTFTPSFKLVLCVNHKPRVSDTTHSFWRRIKVIPFEKKFSGDERDNHLMDKLKKEASGILTWAVKGCLKWQKEGLETPKVIQSATDEYRTEMDIFRQFLEDRTIENEDYDADAAAFYQAYEKWCNSNGEDAKSGTWVGRKMKELGFKKERGNIHGKKKTLYKNIGLLETNRNEEHI